VRPFTVTQWWGFELRGENAELKLRFEAFVDVFALYQLKQTLSSERLSVHQLYFEAREAADSDPLELIERGLALSRQLGYANGEVWYDREVGSVLHELRQTEQARGHLERAGQTLQ